MKKYIIFSINTRESISRIKVDYLKLRASFPGKKFKLEKLRFAITCDAFEIEYIDIWKQNLINGINREMLSGVYGSELLVINDLDSEIFIPLENNEFLTWLREGDLIV